MKKLETRKLFLGFTTVAIGCAFCLQNAQAIGGSEYLFLGTDGLPSLPTTLTLDGGSTVLSTGTSKFEAFGNENRGWWSATKFNFTGNDDYLVGYLFTINTGELGVDRREHVLNNFFTFDISGLSGPVSSAVLNVRRYFGRSDSGATDHTYSLFDVSTDAATLNANDGASAAIFSDLGSGVGYGSYLISVAGADSEILNLTLNAAALADLNTAIAGSGQYFSIGGTLTPGAAVPESGSTAVLLGLSLAAFGLWNWKRSRSVKAIKA